MSFPHFEYSHNVDMKLINIFKDPLLRFHLDDLVTNRIYLSKLSLVFTNTNKKIKYIKRTGRLYITPNNI